MITLSINGTNYKVASKLSELTTAHLDRFADIEVPDNYEKMILTGEVAHLTVEDIRTKLPEYYRQLLRVLSTIPDGYIDEMDAEAINCLSPLIVDISHSLVALDFEMEELPMFGYRKGFGFFFKRSEPVTGYSATAWQVFEAQDVMTDGRQGGVKYLAMIYNGWKTSKMLKHVKAFKASFAAAFFFITSKLFRSLKRDTRLHLKSQQARQRARQSEAQGCEGLYSSYPAQAMGVSAN